MAGQKHLPELLAELKDEIFSVRIKGALYIIDEKKRRLP